MTPLLEPGRVYHYASFSGGCWMHMWDDEEGRVILSPLFWGTGVHLRAYERTELDEYFEEFNCSSTRHWDPAVQARFDRALHRRWWWIELRRAECV